MVSGLLYFYNKPNNRIKELLIDTTLGSNGAKYKLLDTSENVDYLDNPLFLTLERNESLLGNVTFCRRNEHWYIRYFAFNKIQQGLGSVKSRSKKSVIKGELSSFFQKTLDEGYENVKPLSFYAYIEPNNVKSLWMAESFGFKKIGDKFTQTFSRYSPKEKLKIIDSSDWSIVPDEIKNNFRKMNYFFEEVFFQGEFVYALNENNEMIAFSKVSTANWKIESLPGKFGGVLVRIIPFVPFLNRLIKPDKHTFLIPEAVWVKGNDTELLSTFFESMLAVNNQNLLIWWVDGKDKLYRVTKNRINWGIVDRLVGNSPVHVVAKSNDLSFFDKEKAIYSAGMDSF